MTMNNPEKFILDACCGGRMMWFQKKHPNALFIDKRIARKGHISGESGHSVEPDLLMDFRKMDFADESFSLVVFDPPHFTGMSQKSWLAKKYGCLDSKTWRADIREGFDECWRVLKQGGVLIAKWSEDTSNKTRSVPTAEFIRICGRKPLFGHTTGNKSNTHWICFMKL